MLEGARYEDQNDGRVVLRLRELDMKIKLRTSSIRYRYSSETSYNLYVPQVGTFACRFLVSTQNVRRCREMEGINASDTIHRSSIFQSIVFFHAADRSRYIYLQ